MSKSQSAKNYSMSVLKFMDKTRPNRWLDSNLK